MSHQSDEISGDMSMYKNSLIGSEFEVLDRSDITHRQLQRRVVKSVFNTG